MSGAAEEEIRQLSVAIAELDDIALHARTIAGVASEYAQRLTPLVLAFDEQIGGSTMGIDSRIETSVRNAQRGLGGASAALEGARGRGAHASAEARARLREISRAQANEGRPR